ncbi:MAG: T9SS type A sorting domain-containing protein [Bacteroidia bacterium]|jgi:hypothetical protein|nr:T9SS type A sorting domain-containing protein [Bacteroidia bacterium]
MNLKFTLISKLKRLFLSAAICGVMGTGATLNAQVSLYTFSQSNTTYTPITGGTVLGTNANDDERFVDPASPAGGFSNTGVGFPIGFNFTYNGATFDRFAVNANGWISLGQSANTPAVNMTSSSSYTPLSSTSTITPNQLRSRIAGVAFDMGGQAGSELRTELIGTSPNQTRVIQWTNYTGYFQTGMNITFQIRLNESDNSVEVRFGTMTPNTTINTAHVGLGGSVPTDFNNRQTTSNWNSTTAGTANSSSCTFVNTVTSPVSGLNFKWVLIVSALDMQATALASPGTLGCFGTNQTVSVIIRNNGTAAINFATNPVTVNASVTGPNPATFTPVVINTGTLAASATQTVTITTTYNMTTSGAYVFSANTSVAGDGNTLNDAMPNATINVSRVNTFPHVEGFSALPNPAFLVQQVSGTGNWSITTTGNMANPTLAPVQNPGFAFFNSYSFSTGTSSRLITPCYDMTALNNPAIDIWISQDIAYATAPYDRVEVRVSTDGGLTWSAALQTIDRYNATYTTPGWRMVTVPLTGYNNNSSVRIALQGISQFGNNIGIDQVKVYDLVAVDLQPTVLVTPISNSCHSAAENVTVSVRNNGVNTANFGTAPMNITVNVTGASTQTFTVNINSGTLAGGATSNYTVTTAANMTAQGTHNFAISTSSTADGDNTNNNLSTTVGVGDITAFPATENFDGARLGWSSVQLTGTGNWSFLTGNMAFPTLAPRSGSSMAYFNSFNFFTPVSSRLTTPCINFTGVQNPSLEFYMSADNGYPASNDRVQIRVSTDGGATYGPVLFTASRYDAAFTTAGWKRYTVCLSSVANLANVKIAFDAVGEYGNNLAIDDVRLYQSVPAVAGSATAALPGVCIGNGTSLTLAGNTGNIQWQSSPTGLPGSWTNIASATTATLNTGNLSDTTFYRVLVTNTDACALTDSSAGVAVNVYPLPVQVLTDVTQCGGSVTLNAQNAGSTYLWSNSPTTQTITVTTSGSYNVQITSAFGCVNRDTALVTINALPVVNLGADVAQCAGTVTLDAQNAGATFSWSDNSTSQTFVVSTTGTYYVEVTDANNCIASDTVIVTINPLPVVDLGNDSVQCGGSIMLDAANAGAAYLWHDSTSTQTVSVSASGTYYVQVTDANNCVSSDTVNVIINALPVVNLGNDTTQCGGSVVLDAQNPGASYLWCNVAVTQTVIATIPGIYCVIVTDSNGCSASDSIIVNINALPVVNLGPDTTQCGGSVTLDAQNAGASYLWSDTTTAQTLTATATNVYYVTVTDANGCSSTDSVNVTINSIPAVTLTIAADTVCLNDAILSPLPASPAGGTYSGPGVSSNNFDPAVAGAGTHTITYTYTDSNGCTNSASDIIIVDACSGVAENGGVNGSVNLYPNPNNGMFTLVIYTPAASELNIEVFGTDGRAVFNNRVNSSGQFTTQVNLEGFANGIYFVRVTGENGLQSITKVVKQD